MNKILLLIAMIWFHILDDFCLQNVILSKLKQKQFWRDNAPDSMYRYDYIMALAAHAFSWTTMVYIPVIVYSMICSIEMDGPFILFFCTGFISNAVIHAVIDHKKANQHQISLVVDQLFHLMQIFLVWLFMAFDA